MYFIHPSSSLFLNDYRAAERCQLEKRKTINGEDIIWAMEALGFDQYSQLMKIYLHRYKEVNLSPLFLIYIILFLDNQI